MIGISKLYCGQVEPSDALRYGRRSGALPSHLLQFSEDKKPVLVWNMTRRCNLKCVHCYAQAEGEKGEDPISTAQAKAMIDDLARFGAPVLLFSGGEPLVRRDLPELARYATSQGMRAVISTNGTLISKQKAKELKAVGLSYVGISLDGTRELHDSYRKNAEGKPSFDEVIRGVELLKKHEVEFNIMATVNECNVNFPAEFYSSLKELSSFVQFTPVVERTARGDVATWSVPPEKWGKFLCTIFDEWVRHDVGKIFVQYFDSTLANWVDAPPSVCTLARTCGHAGVMEFNGDVYSCDHFVFPEHRLGNIHSRTLTAMMYSERQLQFGKNKHDALPKQCHACRFLFACNGECPKNRFAKTQNGEEGLNYLCQGYYAFFEHAAPYMESMKKELEAERPPANIMQMLRKNELNIHRQ